MSSYRIPFNRPARVGHELDYIARALEAGQISGDGHFAAACSRLLEETLGVERVLMTSSCTHALEMCALLLELEPGDEVIVPSFSFVTTANAFALHGARPVFVDVREDTLNLDEALVQERITSRTRAVVALHYGGVACEMDALRKISDEAGLSLIEDNAHGLFGRYRGRTLGSLGDVGTQSFHETKNFTCGEGGALLINRAEWIPRAEIVREKGTDRSRFFRGQVDKYTWVDLGSSYTASELQMAFLLAQLEERERIQARRAQLWGRYAEQLEDWAAAQDVQLPRPPAHCEHPHHLFPLILPSLETRGRLIAHLRERGILAVFHFLPLNISAMGRRYGGQSGECPVSERISDQLLRLPLYFDLTDAEQAEVVEAIHAFRV